MSIENKLRNVIKVIYDTQTKTGKIVVANANDIDCRGAVGLLLAIDGTAQRCLFYCDGNGAGAISRAYQDSDKWRGHVNNGQQVVLSGVRGSE